MNALAPALSSLLPSRRHKPTALPVNACPAGPAQERALARALRWIADRRHLGKLDDRLLRDVGLTREAVARGVPFASPGHSGGMLRLGLIEARHWRLKLYAPAAEAAGLRREDLAAAARACRAVVAEPRPAPVAGFAILGIAHEAAAPAGSLALTVLWWEAAALHHLALLLPIEDGPVRRVPDRASNAAAILLTARECRAWQRRVLHAARPALAAYLAEDCA